MMKQIQKEVEIKKIEKIYLWEHTCNYCGMVEESDKPLRDWWELGPINLANTHALYSMCPLCVNEFGIDPNEK